MDFIGQYATEFDKYTIVVIVVIIIVLIGIGFIIYRYIGVAGNIPWHKCIVPYMFNPGFTDTEKNMIKRYMNIITEASKTNTTDTGIRFIEKTMEIEFLRFNKTINSKDGSCGNSKVAKQLGGQDINLSSNCITETIVLHELLHSLGFIHEHTRSDRDSYINIVYDNVSDGNASEFDIKNNVVSDNIIMRTDYDYDSIMHYHPYAFSRNEQRTIVSKVPRMDKENTVQKNRINHILFILNFLFYFLKKTL